jgi:hypothetical protein
MSPDQLHQLADLVRQNLLNHIDSEINRAIEALGLPMEEFDDDQWQSLIDMVFS